LQSPYRRQAMHPSAAAATAAPQANTLEGGTTRVRIDHVDMVTLV
jgi:hypothetical protein